MEVKLGAIVDAKETLSLLNKKDCFSVSTAYHLMKNTKVIRSEEELYNQQREKICKKYAKKDPDGNAILVEVDGRRLYSFPEENQHPVIKDLIDLKMQTVNVDLYKISLNELEQAELTPNQLESIEFMLAVEEKEE